MKAADIIEREVDKGARGLWKLSTRSYHTWIKRAIESYGYQPIKAVFDEGNNCYYCGESGRCPGWHTPEEVRTIPQPTNQQLELSLF